MDYSSPAPSILLEIDYQSVDSGYRHHTRDPKIEFKSVRSKLSKNVSLDAVTKKLQVCQMFWRWIRILQMLDGVAEILTP